MDPLISEAARALMVGDILGALNRVALRGDAPALALRGIAMARLGEFGPARALLRKAARAFGPTHPVARARCVIAQAEIALASRDLYWSRQATRAALATLESRGDRVNAVHARHLEARRSLLLGHLDEATRGLDGLNPAHLPPALRTTHLLITAGIAARRLDVASARTALSLARQAAIESGIPGLRMETDRAILDLGRPAARLIVQGQEALIGLDGIAALRASDTLIVDACDNTVRRTGTVVPLATRPALFALARLLAQAWPADVPRERLITHAFRMRFPDETHRARLRVEIGRLRQALQPLATVGATRRGYALAPRGTGGIVVLARPAEERHAALLALLADGEAWSSSSLALALGISQRTTQRALDALEAAGKAQSFGRGPARRWLAPTLPGFTTTLLLPIPPADE